ncbi:UNKNOWN [Stylonychia lemnae]|uniref:Thioredoxin domain-containing protein n=1 Tax=Stylonychia lemnae TaxID=5949 RepID=A0A078A6P7_STYLE|nr:UNKNOWN [Stylonychia lemnae]|eukprot:CDW77925.1 UNKNOWN [Stylonychia lemnae]
MRVRQIALLVLIYSSSVLSQEDQDLEEHQLLTNLTSENFFSEIQKGDWIINVCHDYHWECKDYNKKFKSEQFFYLSDYGNVGYVDLYKWYYFTDYFKAPRSPTLLYIKNGTDYYEFEGDANDLKAIVRFLERGYKKLESKKVPREKTYLDFAQYLAEGLCEGVIRGISILMREIGLGDFHYSIQIAFIGAVIFAHYAFVAWMVRKLEKEKPE